MHESVSDYLVITCGDEMVNTSTSSFDKKAIIKWMNYYFLHTILLVLIYLVLLIIIAINCYYIKHQLKNKNNTKTYYHINNNDIK